jgi:hypothetical protein
LSHDKQNGPDSIFIDSSENSALFHNEFIPQRIYSATDLFRNGFIPQRIYSATDLFHSGFVTERIYSATDSFRKFAAK